MKINNIAIFASGAGSNARKIISHFENSEDIDISLIITNNPHAGVIQVAEETNTPSLLIDKEKLKDSSYLIHTLRDKNIDWIILAGFLWKIPEFLVDHFPKHIINIHPALLPKFGGKGMYGAHVHQAVIAAGEKESGITIHYIDKDYDRGEIILQKRCFINRDDTAESLAEKIHTLEHKWFPRTIEKVIKEAK